MPPKKKLPSVPSAGQSRLNFGSPAPVIPVAPTAPPTEEEPPPPPKKQKHQDRFQIKWKALYSWLDYDEKLDIMWCTKCRSIKANNTMAIGTSNFKTTTLQRHIDGDDHRRAIRVNEDRQHLNQAIQAADSKEEKAITVCLKVVYWLSKECIPLSKYSSLIDLLGELQVPNIESLKTGDRINYTSYTTACDMLKCINKTLTDELNDKIEKSPVLTVMTDESTDIATHHKLCVMARIINPITMVPYTAFLTDVRISSATGAGIFNSIKEHLTSRGIRVERVSGLGTDGATVMTGTKGGLTGQFMRENPHVLQTHCSAHRIALCSEQAAEGIPAMKYYQGILESLFYYFKKSPKRCEEIQSIQALLKEPTLKYREVHKVRWLSFYQALEAVYRTLDSLLTLFSSKEKEKDPKAEGLKKKIGQDFFISTTYSMMDILQPVMRLNLFFQARDVDIARVKTSVDECLKELEDLKIYKNELERPTFEGKLKEDIVEGVFKGQHSVIKSKYSFPTTRRNFIQNLIDNINKRFPEKQLLTSFGVLGLRPVTLLTDDELREWGNESVEVLLEHFGKPKEHSYIDTETMATKTSRSEPVVDAVATREEWLKAKQIVKEQGYPRHTTSEVWGLLREYHGEELPNLLLLAALALTHPVHTSDCERAFSKQNLVTTPIRNRISSDHCEEIMRVIIEGPALKEFDFKNTLREWSNSKSRYIFKK